MNKLNILPLNDLNYHTEDEDCPCKPEVMIVFNHILITHNSFDGREKPLIKDLNLRIQKEQLN